MTAENEYDIKELKAGGLMKLKEPDLFSIRLRVVGGRMEAAQLAALAELSLKYGRGHIHLTTRQGAEIPYVHFRDIEKIRGELADVGLRFGACGRRVRTITACQGGSCPHGLIDPQLIAQLLDGKFFGKGGMPHKFKIGITGCPNACIKPHENDLGIMGIVMKTHYADRCNACGLCVHACPVPGVLSVLDGKLSYNDDACIHCGACVAACPNDAWEKTGAGYALFVGGKMGKRPRFGDRLAIEVRDERHLLRLAEAIIAWFSHVGKEGERFGETIDRVGVEKLVSALREVKEK